MVKDVTVEKLLSAIPPAQLNPTSKELIKKAYLFSEKGHEGQKRRSGEAFFQHPFRVALILAEEVRLDVLSVVAALLHDLVEDTKVTIDKVKEEFGEEVALIVDGLTKLAHVHFRSSQEKQAENFRKMLLAMSKDLRVVMIKIADRLDNIRTISSMPEVKRRTISRETLEIYAPLAYRLGMGKVKIELEEIAFSQLNPEKYNKLKKEILTRHTVHQKFIEEVRREILKVCYAQDLKIECQGRVKHLLSVARKMERQNVDIDQIYDVVAFRILTKSVLECYEVLGLMHAQWRPLPGRFKDYIAMPKPNLYQSLHTIVVGPRAQMVEIQIRTEQMHEVAEYGIAAHWKYKESGTFKDTGPLEWVNRLVEQRNETENPHEFISNVKADLFVEDIYVFTPNGDVLEFPDGATPLDFAYTIHTELGHRTTGAIVNGKVVSLKSHLKSGDCVEIITSSKARPSRDWLKFVKTTRARQKIRTHLRAEEREISSEIGEQMLESAFRKQGKSLSREVEKKEFSDLLSRVGLSEVRELFIEVVYGKLAAPDVLTTYQKVLGEEDETEQQPKARRKKARKGFQPRIEVSGIQNVLIRYAHCCNPIPGDDILGFVTRGRGVTIHRTDCPRVPDFDEKRVLEARWRMAEKEDLHHAMIKVLTEDAPGLLYEMSKVMTDAAVNITKARVTTTTAGHAENIFHVQVHDLQELNVIIDKMEKLKGVISVNRSQV